MSSYRDLNSTRDAGDARIVARDHQRLCTSPTNEPLRSWSHVRRRGYRRFKQAKTEFRSIATKFLQSILRRRFSGIEHDSEGTYRRRDLFDQTKLLPIGKGITRSSNCRFCPSEIADESSTHRVGNSGKNEWRMPHTRERLSHGSRNCDHDVRILR